MATAYIALGSNVGDTSFHLHEALRLLSTLGTVTAQSSFYETKPKYLENQANFLNAVCALETTLSPQVLLQRLKKSERALGRTPAVRNGARVIDMDILTYDDREVTEAELTIPHARMHERAFVLVPLSEIAPELRLPRYGVTVHALMQKLDDRDAIVAIHDSTEK